MIEILSIGGVAKVGDIKKHGLFLASEMYVNKKVSR